MVFKHSLPAGIYSDNLVHDWNRGNLYYFAFDPRTRAAAIVKISATTGALSYVFDVSKDIRGGEREVATPPPAYRLLPACARMHTLAHARTHALTQALFGAAT